MRRVSTRVLPEPAPARIASGAARLVTASRCVGSRPSQERRPRGTVPPGYDTQRGPRRGERQPEQQKAPSSLRCVAARISSGPFPPTAFRPLAPGLPHLLGLGCGLRRSSTSRGWSRSVPSPHRLRSRPSPGCARSRAPGRPGTGLAFTGLRIVRTRRGDMQEAKCSAWMSRVPSDPWSTSPVERSSNRWSPTRSTRSRPRSATRWRTSRWWSRTGPTPEQLGAARAGGTLLGLYEGVPLTSRGPLSYTGVAPDRITIFQRPVLRGSRDDVDELAAQVRVTVLHEVGHYFGMCDERLHELGWA